MLTKEQIASADEKALIDLLSNEMLRRIPESIRADDSLFYSAVDALPRGLRAMAGIHSFNFSMCLDDLAWHFLNHPDDHALKQTLNGLVELELTRIADLFREAWSIMAPHLPAIRAGNLGGLAPHAWLLSIGAQQLIDPMNEEIWAFCESQGDFRLLHSWVMYARNFPERCVDAVN
jgi:hypothetical protein